MKKNLHLKWKIQKKNHPKEKSISGNHVNNVNILSGTYFW